MGRKSRTKGRAFEQETARDLRPAYPGAKRGLGQPRCARECADVEGTPFWVECKRGKRVSARAAMVQARAASDGRPPLVVVREDHSEAVAVVPWDVMLWMLRQLGGDAAPPKEGT